MADHAASNNSQASVTVLLATYGRLGFLKVALESALCQGYSNFEILIVDDGSTEEVVEWLKSIEASESRVRVHFQTHQGVATARAAGIEKASTEYVCILDSDDLLAPNALEILMNEICQNAETQLVFANIRELLANGKTHVRQYSQYDSTRAMTLATLLKPRVPFKHSGTVFRRQTALELGSYNTRLSCKVDVDLYLKFLRAGYLPRHVDKALVDFRMHKNSVSINRLEGIRVWLYLIDEYGPENPLYRMLIKTVRISAELSKRIYLELRG